MNKTKVTLNDLRTEKRKLEVEFDRARSLTTGADSRVEKITVLLRHTKREIAKMERASE